MRCRQHSTRINTISGKCGLHTIRFAVKDDISNSVNILRTLPQKVPNRYRISLHIDDESIICTQGKTYGYEAYQLDAPDDEWKEKIIAYAEEIRRKKG